MTIALTRVDDRLIHGQVAMGWSRALSVDAIVVADDRAAADELQRSLLTMAAPAGVQVIIRPVSEVAKLILDGKTDRANMLLLVRGSEQLRGLVEAGVPITSVNIGNIQARDDRRKLTKEVAASDAEIATWQWLDAQGIKLEIQWLPDQSRTDLGALVRGLPSL